MGFIIRRANPGDTEGILACLRAAFALFESSYTPAGYLDTVLTPEALASRFKSMSLFVAIAEGGEVVGTIACARVGDKEDGEDAEGHLRGMAVLPEQQGSGVAGRLLQQAEAELRALGCSRVTLDTTEPLKRAMRFYERHGYRRTGRVTDFFGMPLYEYAKELPRPGEP
ncbi:MAG TPA: GNAT family N-acetyltransferase [Candidatus Angelobacter sp.]|nr:GNAT family N-acetyltransferase [Candidatus Angelobacter sp.]